ncbi:cardiolipin synthase [Cohnella sp. CFH 77786]|uniref:cardiolipin synthase n=1 Tax=Cohnella sp. CFH 77786 TaxID=2662265 RepID=UPI001C609994|nr:cardiolipin synthase [Cohnella sp. CFH 77786]MBW5448334.1 cardiolipin synthase [Cohnella sp. CFH 77786]
MQWLFAVLVIFVFQAATILVLEYKRPANAMAWLFILFLFPIVGFVLYYFLAREYQRRRRVRRRGGIDEQRRAEIIAKSHLISQPDQMPSPEFAHQERLFKLLRKAGAAPITGCNQTKVLTNAEKAYEAMLEAIRGARHHIHFSSYIIRDDETGRKFRDELIRKAEAGVQVRLLYDGIGSIKLGKAYFVPLQEAGVEYASFFPLRPAFMKKRMNYRNHRKILVVDGTKGFVGGINIGDEYLGKHPRLGFWRDTHLQLEGDAVYGLQEVFLKDWETATRRNPKDPEYFPVHQCTGREAVQIVAGGPNRRDDAIHETLFAALSVAKERIWITTPYFIPDAGIAMALKIAAMSGVDVRLIVPLVPDTYLVHAATMSYVDEMMSYGVRFWQYSRGFIHAKVVIVDRLMASVGTANMDLRSFFSNFETNALLFDAQRIGELEQDFLQDLRDSREIELSAFRKRPRSVKAKQALARMLSPLL